MLLAEEGVEEGDVDVEAAAGDAEAAGAAGEAQEDTAAAAGADTEPLLPTERSGWEGRGAPPSQTFLRCYWRLLGRPACRPPADEAPRGVCCRAAAAVLAAFGKQSSLCCTSIFDKEAVLH